GSNRRNQFCIRAIAKVCGCQAKHECLNAIQRILSVPKSFESEIQLLPITNRNEQVTDLERIVTFLQKIPQRKEIAFRFGHLFAFDKQMLPVNPKPHELPARDGLALCNFIFVMRENVVDAAAMNIQRFTEMFHRHGGTFQVPSGASLAKGCVPSWL